MEDMEPGQRNRRATLLAVVENRVAAGHQLPLFEVGAPDPDPTRLAFDIAVADALGVAISEETIRALYQVIIAEMIITRGLTSD